VTETNKANSPNKLPLWFMDNSPTNQLADSQLADKQTRRNWYDDVSAHAEM